MQRGHIPGGQRPRDGDNPPPEEAGFGHTDHAPTAAAAPTPWACTGTVAERIKAQDATDTISDQHHLSEKVAQLRGFVTNLDGGHSCMGTGCFLGTCLTPDLPAETCALR